MFPTFIKRTCCIAGHQLFRGGDQMGQVTIELWRLGCFALKQKKLHQAIAFALVVST